MIQHLFQIRWLRTLTILTDCVLERVCKPQADVVGDNRRTVSLPRLPHPKYIICENKFSNATSCVSSVRTVPVHTRRRLFHIDCRRPIEPEVGGLARSRKSALEMGQEVPDVGEDDLVVLGDAGGVESRGRLARRDEAEEAGEEEHTPVPGHGSTREVVYIVGQEISEGRRGQGESAKENCERAPRVVGLDHEHCAVKPPGQKVGVDGPGSSEALV